MAMGAGSAAAADLCASWARRRKSCAVARVAQAMHTAAAVARAARVSRLGDAKNELNATVNGRRFGPSARMRFRVSSTRRQRAGEAR